MHLLLYLGRPFIPTAIPPRSFTLRHMAQLLACGGISWRGIGLRLHIWVLTNALTAFILLVIQCFVQQKYRIVT